MNHIIRTIWNEVTRTFVAVDGPGKTSRSQSDTNRIAFSVQNEGLPLMNEKFSAEAPVRASTSASAARSIIYSSVSPMALEPRFVFDGAGATEVLDDFDGAVVDEQPQEEHVSTQSDVDLEAIVQQLDAEASDLFKMSSDKSSDFPVLDTAMVEAEQRIAEFLQQDNVLEQLFATFSGNNSEPTEGWRESAQKFIDDFLAGDVSVRFEMLPGDVLEGSKAAFASEGPDGEPVIYLNQQWLQEGVDQETLTRVLIEEVGHLADHLINHAADTEGDEGQAFAQMVTTGITPVTSLAPGSDAGVIIVDGQEITVEFAAFSFINAYEMVYDLDNDGQIDNTERWAEKEQNTHYFNTQELGQAVVDDDGNSPFFSGNDVSAIGIKIVDETLYGWISRPIKANGIVRGFYFWTDDGFLDLKTAQNDGNTDGDRDVSDNRGFLLVVDQAWFAGEIESTSREITFTADNTKDGNLGTIDVAAVGSSSDKVDSALNALIVPNSPPTPIGDSLTVAEYRGATTVTAANGLLNNDTDPDNDLLTVTGFSVGGVTTNAGSSYTITDVGNIAINADGSYSFTPVVNYNGPVPPITYTVSDGNGGTATATLSIVVTEVNDSPVSTDDEITIGKNSTVVLGLEDFGTFSDVDGDALVNVQITAIPTGTLEYYNGSKWVQVSANDIISVNDINGGKLRYTPVTDASGTPYSTLQFKVSDGELYSVSPYTLTINVNATNTIPVANDDTAPDAIEAGGVNNGTAGTNPTGNVLSNDEDADGDTLRVTGIGGNEVDLGTTSDDGTVFTGSYGALVMGADGSYLYTVDNNNAKVQALRTTSDTLTETFSYTIADGSNATDTALLTVVIRGSNDAPVAVDDYSALQEGELLSGNYGTVSANAFDNDTDVDGSDGKTFQALTGEASGTSVGTVSTDFSILFGNSVNSFKDTDFDLETVPVFVKPTGSPDYAELLDSNNVQVRVTSAIIKGSDILFAFSDPQALIGIQNISGAVDGIKIVVKGKNFFGTYSETITNGGSSQVVDISGVSGTISVGMVVSGTDVNGSSFSTTISEVSYDSNGVPNQITLAVAQELSSTALRLEWTVGSDLIGKYGKLSLFSDGSYTYTLTSDALEPGQSFTEQFSYTMEDTAGLTSSATINIALSSPSILTVENDLFDVDAFEDEVVSGNVLENDIPTTGTKTVTNFNWGGQTEDFGNPITLSGVGTLTINQDGSFIFTPASNYNGTVPTALYTATNGTETASATLRIVISPVNDLPVANNDTSTAYEAGGINNATIGVNPTGNVLSNDEDTDGDTLTVTLIGGEAVDADSTSGDGTSVDGTYGTLIIGADGSYRYTVDNSNTDVQTLNIGESLQDEFTYTMSDGTDTDTATLTITINGANDAPVNTVPGPQSLNSYETLSLTTLEANDEDDDIVNVKLSVGNGTLSATLNGSGTLTGTGTASSPLTISGTKAEINAMLASVIYTPTVGFSGSDSLRMLTTDDTGLTDLDFVAITVNEDDRALSVTGTTVNEASPYVMFSVTGTAEQWVTLELGATGSGAGHASQGADFLPNLEYFNDKAWVDYTGGSVQIPIGGTSLLVRTAVLQDNINEGDETLKLTATNQAGTSATANATIVDDGTGSIFLSSNNTITPNHSADAGYPAYLDDDRPISVNNIAVNEASPHAVFTVTGNSGQVIKLNLIEGTAKDGTNATDGTEDYQSPMQISSDNGANWVNYTGGSVQIPIGGTSLLVRAALINDTAYEGQEGFSLEVTRVSQNDKVYGVASIYDDGTGVIFDEDGTEDIGATKDDDRAISIDDLMVNEASDTAVFTITGDPGQTVLLEYIAEEATTNSLNAPEIKVWDGLDWVDYDTTKALPTFDDDGKIYVSVNITDEQELEVDDGEKFPLRATLAEQNFTINSNGVLLVTNTATATDGKTATGTATIKDDGTGMKYTGTFTEGAPTTSTEDLDDDGPKGTTIGGDISGNGTEDTNMTGTLTATDQDGFDTTTRFTVTADPSNGTATIDANGDWSYTPDADFNGSDSFTVTVKDALGNETTQVITITVNPEQDAFDDTASTTNGQAVTIDVLDNDKFEGTPVTITGVGTPSNGTAVLNNDGTITYTPTANFTGTATFTYTANTEAGVAETATVTVSVTQLPAPPTPDAPDPVELPTIEFEVTEVNRPPAAPFNSTVVMTTSPVGPSTADQPVTSALMDRSFRESSGVPFTFAEVLTRGEGYKVVVLEGVDPILSVYNGITDQFAQEGTESSFALPYDAFAHTDPNEEISLAASLADGEDLPDWLQFDAVSGTFVLQAPDGFSGELRIKVNARDSKGQEVETLFRFIVGASDRAAGDGADGDGRSSLSDQIREAGLQPALVLAAEMVQDFADEWLLPLADAQKT